MQKITEMTEDEMTEFAESFAWYEYGEGERGMVPFYPKFPDRTPLVNYLKAIIRPALAAGCVWATSEKHEGIIIITDTTNAPKARHIIRMLSGMVKALSLRGFLSVMKKFQAGGESLEKKFRREKRDFIQIELLCVKKSEQGKGFMRPLVEKAFALADEKGLPVIITTDATLKKDKYAHFGLNLVNTRKIAEGSLLYDLVREGIKQP